jgi:gluconate 5-dehydrogenase
MKRQNAGSIINIASMYGIVSPNPALYRGTEFFNPANYGSGKAAIIQFSRYTACFFAKYGIRVNAISPGAFPNQKVQKDQIFLERLCEKVPLGRIGQPEELKGAVVFLASRAASYITGINLVVDGGWTAW